MVLTVTSHYVAASQAFIVRSDECCAVCGHSTCHLCFERNALYAYVCVIYMLILYTTYCHRTLLYHNIQTQVEQMLPDFEKSCLGDKNPIQACVVEG
jgi:hypothetical protein